MNQPAEPPLTPLQAAALYAEVGWCVVPIGPGQKYPQGLDEWQNHATDNAEVHQSWWTGLYRDYGIGILTGPRSDNWVLDVDRHDVDGEAALTNLQSIHGQLPDTVTAHTGGGGRHLFFQWDPDRPVVNVQGSRRARLLPAGLDVRGDGGQVVAAPSVHANGQPYTWAPGKAPWEVAVADAPDWLYPYLEFAEVEATVWDERTSKSTSGPADWFRENGPGIPVMLERHGWTFERTARNGDQMWLRPGKRRGEGHSALFNPDDGPLRVFSTDASLDHLWRQSRSGEAMVASLSPWDTFVALEHEGDVAAAIRHCEDKGYVNPETDWATKWEPPEITEVDEETGEVTVRKATLEDELLGYASIRDLPPPEPLLPGWLFKRSLAAVSAPPKTGKTFVTLDMALSLAAGVGWVGGKVARQGRVLYLIGEGVAGVGQRVSAWAEAHPNASAEGWIDFIPRAVPLKDRQQSQELVKLVKARDYALVVVDTLARAAVGVEENSAKEMGEVIAVLDQIKAVSDACVLVVHHTGKDAGKGLRGSSAIGGALDTSLVLKGDVRNLWITTDFQKDAAGDNAVQITFRKVGNSIVPAQAGVEGLERNDTEVRALEALRWIEATLTKAEWRDLIMEETGVSKATAYRVMGRLVELGLAKQTGSGDNPRFSAFG